MGHAHAGTMEHYQKRAERQMAEYGAYLPAEVNGGELGSEQRKDAGEESGEPQFRVVGA